MAFVPEGLMITRSSRAHAASGLRRFAMPGLSLRSG